MSRVSPTQRAKADLKKMGAEVAIVEKWNPHAKIRQDCFGFIDLIVLLGTNMIGVQVTSGSNHAARKAKIAAEPLARAWLMTGALIELWSYSKKKPRGERARWECRKEEITLRDLETTNAS